MCFAQIPPGFPDSSFSATNILGREVSTIAVQSDGRILIGGVFTNVNGIARSSLARLLSDGALDSDFNPSFSTNSTYTIRSILLRKNGTILLGGSFERGIVSLKMNGVVDSDFLHGSAANSSVDCMLEQSDGKIILGGAFTSFNGIGTTNLVRLLSDGSVDSNFNVGRGPSGRAGFGPTTPLALAVQNDGRLLVGSGFTNWNGAVLPGLVRLNSDGSVDNSFQPPQFYLPTIAGLKPLADGSVLVVGGTRGPFGPYLPFLQKLRNDGSVDPRFQTNTFSCPGVSAIVLQPDGRILVAGYDLSDVALPYPIAKPLVFRFNADGSPDKTYIGALANNFQASPPARDYPTVKALALEANGSILAGGSFDHVNGLTISCLVRLTDGPPGLFNPNYSKGSATMSLVTKTNQSYTFQRSGNLNSTNWQSLYGFKGTGSTMVITDTNSAGMNGFYRVTMP